MTDDVHPTNAQGQEQSQARDVTATPSGRQVTRLGQEAPHNGDHLPVVVTGASDLHDATHKALAEALVKHGRVLLNEASRLEAAANPGLAPPLITPTMIHDADTLQRIGYAQPGKADDRRNWMLCSLLATFVGGHFTNNLTESWGAIGFVICGAAALICFNKGSQS
ncbi:hypothetical protein [Actinoplanes friuliensis]|uniref:hypothetical protein n=1 Tax=Actinoplanes friuliensis TaxID=196914 RepID=UPI0011DDA4D5|nr:hypothetical protein [Actinoplanes friuliensis]